MNAQEVLSYLNDAGLHLDTVPERPGRVRVTPVHGELTEEHRRLIRANKPAIVALLTGRPIPVPDLTPQEQDAIQEALDERAAIREFDGGEPRPLAEQQAREGMRVYRVLVAMDTGIPARWATMIAPGCDLTAATAAACNCFGPERVLEVRERPYPQPVPNRAPTTSGDRPMPPLPSPQPHHSAA